MIAYTDGTSLMVTYTPCDTENGMPEDLANARSRLAVESRMSPLFVHDPRRGATLADRFCLDDNPDPQGVDHSGADHSDERGRVQVKTLPLTPADFAIGEQRFAKQFRGWPPTRRRRRWRSRTTSNMTAPSAGAASRSCTPPTATGT